MPWRQLEFRCTCGAITLLPPAPPLVVRVEQPCRLQFTLHSEEQAHPQAYNPNPQPPTPTPNPQPKP